MGQPETERHQNLVAYRKRLKELYFRIFEDARSGQAARSAASVATPATATRSTKRRILGANAA